MNTKWPWLVLVLVLVLMACTDPDAPNGKEGVLFFRLEYENPVAEGLVATLTLPGATPQRRLDFADTTLVAESTPGVSVVDTRPVPQTDGSLWHQLTYRCESAGSRELRVRVLDRNKTQRYTDAFNVTCARAASLGHDYVGADDAGILPGGHFLVGAKIQISLELRDRNGASLSGLGQVELLDEQGVTRPMPGGLPSRGRSLYLEALEPGSGVRARFGGLEAPLPVQVVEDTAISLEVGLRHGASNEWSVIADARHIPTANRVGGLEPCTWEVRFSSGKVTEAQGKCFLTIPDNLGPGTVCVSAHGHTACTDFPDYYAR
ncbi:hypothetical protein ATI61_102306 [Archangium gephyra]|uniref:Lipoprotein n=1 Tax=Archangium gephyra TaxID=48 RepID=A0AAC8QDR0_9BACT|nr:hypothetical protein [Archangium gephyra]AKJ05241.1 Hypothetical protein AA314_06867 [Archangium gephyra]REG35932.1 hypothetical protein ATI61_102306 [Archangium gephyra]